MAKQPEPSKPVAWSIYKIPTQGHGGCATGHAANPARSKRRLGKESGPGPLCRVSGEPGPYARDQVREETRTPGQHCKKRAADFGGGRSCRPRLKTTPSSLLPALRCTTDIWERTMYRIFARSSR
jgi:hypothetical protein